MQDGKTAASLTGHFTDSAVRKWVTKIERFSRVVVQPEQPGVLDSLHVLADAFAGDAVWLVPTLMLRSDARLAAADTVGAIEDLDSAIAIIRGPAGDDPWLRGAVMDQARKRVDQLVMLHVRNGSYKEALAALERSRIPLISADREARAGPHPGEMAVEYALIDDTLLIWTKKGDTVNMVRDTVVRDSLVRTIQRLGIAMEAEAPRYILDGQLSTLYEMLMRPIAHLLVAETPLVFLADGEIAGAPFDALRDARRQMYLVEYHPIRFAPTLADAGHPPLPNRRDGRALLVADPVFDRGRHPLLHPLPGARGEVDSLKRQYPNSVVLVGASATADSMMAAAVGVDIIHYAGHSIFDDTRPERSYLLLADADSRRLTATEVREKNLAGVRLVVLSACRTLRTRGGRSGGFAGLSGAFLGAGAGGVLGRLWMVNDERAEPIMLPFHREYKAHGDPAAALRAAQRQMIVSSDRHLATPAAWAGFRYAGR